jgi:oligoribonuclease (3'-5' exoribonuclease)
MNLKLHKPLCIFDLETTGTNIGKDRIVEICILKVNLMLPEKAKHGVSIRKCRSQEKAVRSTESMMKM